jgi:hypothetical protein
MRCCSSLMRRRAWVLLVDVRSSLEEEVLDIGAALLEHDEEVLDIGAARAQGGASSLENLVSYTLSMEKNRSSEMKTQWGNFKIHENGWT